MTYEEVEAFLENVSKYGSKPGLGRIRRLMEILGNVQEELLIIHIAGTNGKGSVGAFLERIFEDFGFSVGRFSSPAVFSKFEMWSCHRKRIEKDEYTGVMSQVKNACDFMVSEGKEHPTLFEIQTAAAFVWFAGRRPDVVLLETGMGGTEDSTNLIRCPLCSVLTSIGMDHREYLGNSLREIASQKAGIIKPGRPVFVSIQDPEAEEVIRNAARDRCAPISVVRWDQTKLVQQTVNALEFYYKDLRLNIRMTGQYQMENAAVAIRTAYYMIPLLERYTQMMAEGISIDEIMEELSESVREAEKTCEIPDGLEKNIKNLWQHLGVTDMNSFRKMKNVAMIAKGIEKTVLPGRFEVLSKKEPWFILDGAHNPAAARRLADTVRNDFRDEKLVYIVGVLADKEYEQILQIMAPFSERVYCITPNNPRALSAEKLAQTAQKYYADAEACSGIKEAVWKARDGIHSVLAFGSLSYLGELREYLRTCELSNQWK